MKNIKPYLAILLLLVLLASCATRKAPIQGWHKKDKWFAPTDWHTKNHAAGF